MTTAETPDAAIVASRACSAGRLGGGADAREGGHGRRAVGVPAPGAGLHGADQAGAEAGGGQPGLDQVGRRRLAVGAGDADDRQPAARLAVDPVGDAPSTARGSSTTHTGQAGARRRRPAPGRVGEDGDGAAGRGVGGEPDAVRAGAGQRRVEVAGADLARRERDPGDLRLAGPRPPTGSPTRSARCGEGQRAVPRGPGRRPGSVGVTGLQSTGGGPRPCTSGRRDAAAARRRSCGPAASGQGVPVEDEVRPRRPGRDDAVGGERVPHDVGEDRARRPGRPRPTLVGRSRSTATTYCGSSAGANPTNVVT